MKYQNHFGTKSTPQDQAIPGREADMAENNAGGMTFTLDKWGQFQRFIILGAEGGSYYCTEREMTLDNAKAMQACVAEDGPRAVKLLTDISVAGRAPKQAPTLFALAYAAAKGDDKTKKAVLDAFPKVVRTGTHLFQILDAHRAFGGWGRNWRKCVASWYEKDAGKLAYQLVKYRQREGWSHADALRLAHVKAEGDRNLALAYAAGKIVYDETTGEWFRLGKRGTAEAKDVRWEKDDCIALPESLNLIQGFAEISKAKDVMDVCRLILAYRLPWEAVPTEFLGEAKVWGTLLPEMPLTATLRNLGRMTANGLLTQGSEEVKTVIRKLSDAEAVKAARIHPIAALSALRVYAHGHGARGKLSWNPVSKISDCLDDLFYTSFGNVEPIGKPVCLALDVSGSMSSGDIAGVPGLTPREASSAMAMVTARVEKDYEIMAFSKGFIPLDITPKMRLDDICRKTAALPFDATDCAIPMIWAAGRQAKTRSMWGSSQETLKASGKILPFDGFVIYTDSETWVGGEQPVQALQAYRQKSGRNAKLVVVGLTATGFTIADPRDPGMLDVVGFDTAAPNIISDFIRG